MEMKYNKVYELARNKLIQVAEKKANDLYGNHSPGGIKEKEIYAANWSKCFHDTMKELAKGL